MGAMRTVGVALLAVVAAGPSAHAERLIASLSSQRVEITSNFSGVDLILFGAVEGDRTAEAPPRSYDIVATATGPREQLVMRRKKRVFGIWVNTDARSFDVPSYLSVLANRPVADIADADTLHQLHIGLAETAFGQPAIGEKTFSAEEPFRQALLRIERERGFYVQSADGVMFLTSSVYRASIFVPGEAPVGNYEVDIKLFADGDLIAHTVLPFKIVTVGFEQFITAAAAEHGVLYGLATAAMALATGWMASIVFRRD